LGVLTFLALPALASSHDLWVVPGRFVLEPGEKVRVFLSSGDDFPQSMALLGRGRIESFFLHTASGERPVGGFATDGKSLTVQIAAPDAGTVILALAVKPRLIRLRSDEFSEYLREDGLPQILELREKLGESDQAAVERYAKSAKAILRVGDPEDDTWSKRTGLKLEIVPDKDPYAIRPGQPLPVVVLFEGEPLGGLTVMGARAGHSADRVAGVTDAEGRVSLILPGPGRWYLRAIHMIRLQDDPQAQWESFWSTVTFEVLS
jgi:hypothetical protein